MRMALFHPWIYLKGGIERTILEMATRSRHDWTIFTGRYAPEDTFPEFRNLNVVASTTLSVSRRVGDVARACFSLVSQRTDFSEYGAAVVSCDGIGNLMTLRASGAPLVCLCHTPLKVAYDQPTRRRWVAELRPGLPTRLAVRAFAAADRLTWSRYERVFCVSEEVQRRLLDNGLVEQKRTEVLHPGVDLERFSPVETQESFFLVPGRIMWTKNIELAISSFVRMKESLGASCETPPRLVIAGMVDDKSVRYRDALKALAGARTDIEFIESPTDDTLLDLYRRCLGVLFTPLNEDWGLVALEAMACGKPVIAVDRGGPRESVSHGETGFRCAADPESFASFMSVLATDSGVARQMGVDARRRAETFGWQQFVGRMDEYLESLATEGTKGSGTRP